MRESISFAENFINGRRIEKIKMKERSQATGVFKVQLFDSLTGKKTYEAKSENRITVGLANAIYMQSVYSGILDNSNPDHLNRAYYDSYSKFAPNAFLVLSDTEVKEDKYDHLVHGNTIGYSDLWNSYSGSDKYRGSINTSESKRYSDTKHFVVDFPTHAANGTFRSIYTLGCIGTSQPYSPRLNSIYYDYNFYSSSGTWKFNGVNICVDENYIYVLKQNTNQVGLFDKESLKFKKEIIIEKSCRAISYDRVGNVWGLATTGKVVYKFSKQELLLIETINLPSSSYFSTSNTTIDISVNEGFIYVTQKGYNSTSETYRGMISKVGRDGTYFNSLTLEGNNDHYITKLKTGSEILISSISNKVYCVDGDLNVMYANPSSWNKLISKTTAYSEDFTYDWNTEEVYSGLYNGDSSTNYLRRGYFVPALSHTLLPEPITKTPTNTMKIQYDITVERVGVFDMRRL